jgi:hypothetical protein
MFGMGIMGLIEGVVRAGWMDEKWKGGRSRG